MSLAVQIRSTNWRNLFFFYGTVLAGTYLARKLPNLLNLLLAQFTDIPFSFNYNHGIAVLLLSLLFYRFSRTRRTVSLLGTDKRRSLLFPLVLLVCYTAYGIDNSYGINRHVWAPLLCCLALGYNIMEEFAWRGYLADSLGPLPYWLKSIVSGLLWGCWHLLVFNNFDPYGGFPIFLLFCVVFSFILNFAVQRTRSLWVAACVHAFILQTNIAALVCLALFGVLLLTWNMGSKSAPGIVKQDR
ncbi:CPBP family intramembrane glutamic endopeptidase [Taibaiella chishuiensis]|uniref:CAAX prenyl protease-like protein n=1 Tax=Taibaiella chishuiensis TaxID=1434707 RepID=A0A2P8D8E4_9BACT|nr:CPBP family intramembrane glutamic endopeptidase [Taibaiella chishuiensis]PSK93472.1 CAAX prenyl protease-like protein [Taibaiella chishuiensis]